MLILKRLIPILVVITFLTGCGAPSVGGAAPSKVLPVAQALLVEAPPGSTATPTAFLPLPPTPTYIPTDFPTSTPVPPTLTPTPKPTVKPTQGFTRPVSKTWGDYPGPSIWPDIDVPAPTGLLAQPKGQINILLLGSDQRPQDPSFRTDTILLLTLNPANGTVNITSFPRDLYVYIPGWTVQRINTAMQVGGFDELALTFEYNFGVHPNHYVLINFDSFKRIIRLLGGIDVEVAVTLTDHRDGYGDYYTMPAGTQHMDGETALWYVRARHTTNDFDRGRRQQEVIVAIFRKLLTLNALENAQGLFKIYSQSVTTDLTYNDLRPLVPVAATVRAARIHHYYISPSEVYNWVTTQGAMVLVPIRDAVLSVMHNALNSP
jgi:LCP family protein required for cell wall assembly